MSIIMTKIKNEARIASILPQEYDDIELCPCGEDEDDVSSRPSELSAFPTWEPIIIYRKDKKKQRLNSPRCQIHSHRIIYKTGRSTPVHRTNVSSRYTRYMRDLSNTMVNGRWRWVTFSLVLCFSSLWLFFGWIWMLISQAHGDLDKGVTGGNRSCSVGVEGFAGFLLMSIETQTTIGYGSRYPTEDCVEGVFMICLQMIIGIGVEGAVLGMFYVKMTRPRSRDCRKIFSKIAVVCQRDGFLCLIFRISDQDHLHLVGTVVQAWMMETCPSAEGEYVDDFQIPLKLENFGLLLWPLTIVHRIDKNSPLYDVSAKDLLTRKFEIIVTLLGSSDSTGQLTQSRTSYLSSEIHWGYRFRSCVYYDETRHSYIIHQELMNVTESVDTPLCSAQRLDEVLGEIKDNFRDTILEGERSPTSGIGSMTCSSPESGRNWMGQNSPVIRRNKVGCNSEVEWNKSEPVVKFDEILETCV